MADQLDTLVLGACREFGARTALGDGQRRLSYGELADEVRTRARLLDQLLGASVDRVGLYAANSVDYVVSYLAVLHTGRVAVLIDAAFGEHELAEIHRGCGVSAFLADRGRPTGFPLDGIASPLAGAAHELVRVDPGRAAPPLRPDTAVCRFTSGSTGVPKCLEFSAAAVHAAAVNWIGGTGLSGADRTLCLAVLTNGLAYNTSLLSTFLVGAQLHLYRGLPTSAKIADALRASRATRLVAFPLVYRLLGEADLAATTFAGLRLAISAGAALPAEVRTRFEDRYGVRIADYYGVAEAGPCTFERDPAVRLGLGSALPGVTLRTAPNPSGQREVYVRTASMATRYLNAPGLLEQNLDSEGFYATGDLGYLEDDRLFVTGRVGGPINLAGRKVDPREVEQAVCDIPEVRDAVVFADLDATDQVFLHAAVSTGQPLRGGDIVAGCRGRLAPYKIPQKVTFVPEIPRSSSGKVRMADLRRLVGRVEEGA